MANVTSIFRTPVQRGSDGDGGSNLRWEYLVQFDAPATVGAALAASLGADRIPAYGDVCPENLTLRCRGRDAEPAGGNRCIWRVSVEWGTQAWSFNSPPGEGAEKWNVQIEVAGIEVIEDSTNVDIHRKAIRTTAKEAFAPIPVIRYDEQILVRYQTRSINWSAIAACRGKINDATVSMNISRAGVSYARSFPSSTLKCGNATYAIEIGPGGVGYWNVTIPLLYRSRTSYQGLEIGWTAQVSNRGYYYIDDSSARQRSNEMVYLAQDGKKLPDGDDAVLLEFDMIPFASFTELLSGIII